MLRFWILGEKSLFSLLIIGTCAVKTNCNRKLLIRGKKKITKQEKQCCVCVNEKVLPHGFLGCCCGCERYTLVLSLVAGFFSELLTWAKKYFVSNRCFFKYHVGMFPLMCGSKGKCLVINSSYHIHFHLSLAHFVITFYTCFGLHIIWWLIFQGVSVVIPLMI